MKDLRLLDDKLGGRFRMGIVLHNNGHGSAADGEKFATLPVSHLLPAPRRRSPAMRSLLEGKKQKSHFSMIPGALAASFTVHAVAILCAGLLLGVAGDKEKPRGIILNRPVITAVTRHDALPLNVPEPPARRVLPERLELMDIPEQIRGQALSIEHVDHEGLLRYIRTKLLLDRIKLLLRCIMGSLADIFLAPW